MKILITGGAGMIGANLSKKLLDRGFEVVIFDDLSSGLKINIDPRVTFIQGDVSDIQSLQSLFIGHQFDYIFHLAALFANQNSVDNPEKDLRVNGLGTLLLLQNALEQYKAGYLKKLIYASSSCVYGMFNGSVKEDAPFNLETPYAITKLVGEHYTRYFGTMYGLPVTMFRFFNSYGPGELPGRYRNVIPNFINLALRNLPLNITGTGEETRDFTYISDTVSGILASLDKEVSLNKVYNIATGIETPIKTLAEKIIEYTGSKSVINYVPARDWDHTKRRCGNIDSIKEQLGYKPQVSLDEGLTNTIAWLKQHINVNE